MGITTRKFHNLAQYSSVQFMDLYPHGYLVFLDHCIFLDIPIVCMIPINSVGELSKSLLPCGHSPSRPRLRHPLLCYTVPWVIHLSLPRIYCTRIILETSLSLTVEASLRLSLLRHPSGLCYHNKTCSRVIMAYHRVLMSQQ
jgi:hypothetical protein